MSNKFQSFLLIWLLLLSFAVAVLFVGQGLHNDEYDNSNLKATACDTELLLERTANLTIDSKARRDRQIFIRNYLNSFTRGDFKIQYEKVFTLQE